MDSRTVEVCYSFGESVLLKFPEFPKCGKPDIRLKRSVIGEHVITVEWSCGARNPLPSDIIFFHINTSEIPRGKYSQENWVGCAARFPKALHHLWAFITKICDFPYPIYDLKKNGFPCTVALIKHGLHWAFVQGLIDKDQKVSSS